MANHVRSRVEVESPTKEIHEFMSKFDDSCTGLFETESGPNTCKVVFGDDWKFNIDDIGSKWIFAEEAAYSDFEEGITDELVFTSAWSFPEEFFSNLTKKLQEISDDFELTVTVDEESEDFVGGGVGNKNGFAYIEEDDIEPLDYDNDDDEYIDEHWDMIDEEKWSCVEAARNGLNHEK